MSAVTNDMSKAYNGVYTLVKWGLERKWIDWVMSCVQTTSYDLLVNN